MYDAAVIWHWIEFAVRWLHVITAIAWVGSSFYFIALDLGLNREIDGPADGEEWQVHGGGFYHVQKYLVAPKTLPAHLTWFKWESYSTWLSGAALLMVVYWVGAEIYLIDTTKIGISVWQGILISAASLAVGWVVYDLLCRSKLGDYPTILMLVLFAILVAVSFGYNQIFTGRAALLHVGAFTATLMTGNVFFVIMPNQRIVVGDLKAGRTPHAKYGKIAKLRSTHNNYLTLPVIFLMLSNHYPLAFATEWNWVIACLVFLIGVLIRHYFNNLHAKSGKPHWTWAIAAILFLIIAWLSAEGAPKFDAPAKNQQSFLELETTDDAHRIVLGRCSMCHSNEPFWEGIHWPPKGIVLESKQDLARNAQLVYLQAAKSTAMPPANVTHMSLAERQLIYSWYLAGVANQ